MKSLIYLLGIGVVGYMGYSFFFKKDSEETIITDPPQNAYLQTQPQQVFPLSISKDPRVDNADQPWFGGDRGFLGSVQDAAGMIMSDTGLNYETNQSWSDLASTYTH